MKKNNNLQLIGLGLGAVGTILGFVASIFSEINFSRQIETDVQDAVTKEFERREASNSTDKEPS